MLAETFCRADCTGADCTVAVHNDAGVDNDEYVVAGGDSGHVDDRHRCRGRCWHIDREATLRIDDPWCLCCRRCCGRRQNRLTMLLPPCFECRSRFRVGAELLLFL